MPNWSAIEGGEEDEFRLPSIWDQEDEGVEDGPARGLPVDGELARSVEKQEGAGGGDGGSVAVVPYPFGCLEGAAQALAALDERLADEGARKRWYAAVRRIQAAEQGRLCGFGVDVADACLVEFDSLSAGQSRFNGMWVVARGLKAARLVQRRVRAGVPDVDSVSEICEAALGRWGREESAGAERVCGELRSLADCRERGLLVFAKALSVVGCWVGLDAEERAVMMGVMAPWLGRAFVATRWCSLYLMGNIAWGPALWEARARSGGASWLGMCLEGVGERARRGHNGLRQMELRYELALKASPARRRSHSYQRAVDLVFECPLVDVASVMAGLGLSRAGAQGLIGELVRSGVLRMSRRGRGRRYDAWQIGDIG